MTAREVLVQARNHSSEVREILLMQETILSGMVNGLTPVNECNKNTITEALGLAKDKIDAMIDAVDLLEEE